MSGAYYNEFDPFAAAWLRELIKAGHIPAGEVDERDMREVHHDDLRGFTQHHFFAGIGGWAYAARLAGWPDDRPLFTGSPPCQPFSTAGKQLGKEDDRHLAPHWLELVKAVRPKYIAGEQVANAVNQGWLRNPAKEMLELRKGVAAHEFLKQFKGSLSGELHELCQRFGAREEEEQEDAELSRLLFMENEESRARFVLAGKEQGEDERDGFLVGPGGYTGTCGCGHLPGHGHPIESSRGEDVGFTIAGSGGQHQGIHPGQRPDSYLCPECNGERVGGKQNSKGGRRDTSQAAREIERLSEDVYRKFNEASTAREFAWLDDLLDELENQNYTTGAIVLPACGIGAPHIRQRIFFVGRLAHAGGERSSEQQWQSIEPARPAEAGTISRMDNGISNGWQPGSEAAEAARHGNTTDATGGADRHGAASQIAAGWNNYDWLLCRDGKWRPVESGTFPLANGVPARVGRLRGYGNAIVPQVAAEVLRELMG